MIRIKGQEEYTVWCENCKKTLIFDSPEDLIKANNNMYCIVCPLCKKDIWFHGFDTIMDPNFTKNIKYADINQQKVAEESFRKRLKELRDEVQKEEEKDYLEICLEACEAYAEELGDEYFDQKPTN